MNHDDAAERRRNPKDRIVYARGPIIRGLEVFSSVAGLAAVVALVISLTAISGQISEVQKARRSSAYDSCILLRGLVFAATPKTKLPEATTYLAATPLRDCVGYSIGVVKGR